MSKEKEFIRAIQEQMPKTTMQFNKVFESDAEIVSFNGKKMVYNIDEFSEEDMLREHDPYTLGWNMAVGSISDIYATGGTPVHYAHSLVVNKTWTKVFVEQLAKGVGDVLRETGTAFIGGDFGTSDRWRYTGSVIGEMEGTPMLRSGAKKGDAIFITGNIGIGNVEAALKLYSNHPVMKNITNRFNNRFKLRSKEAQLIKKYSYCCIDTSDGVYNALSTITELSKMGFEVNSLPYDQQGLLLSKLLRVPKELLFLGECGEYELLFTINREKQEEFIQEAEKHHLSFYKIGEIKGSNIKLLCNKSKKIDLCTYKYSARDYENPKEYLKEVIRFIDNRN